MYSFCIDQKRREREMRRMKKKNKQTNKTNIFCRQKSFKKVGAGVTCLSLFLSCKRRAIKGKRKAHFHRKTSLPIISPFILFSLLPRFLILLFFLFPSFLLIIIIIIYKLFYK